MLKYSFRLVIQPNGCLPAGCGQFFTVRTWLDRQDRSVDDWLWKDSRLALTSYAGPPHSLGGGQSRRWLPVGSGQPHRNTDQYATSDVKMCQNEISAPPLILLIADWLHMDCSLKIVVGKGRSGKVCYKWKRWLDVISSKSTFLKKCQQLHLFQICFINQGQNKAQ